MQRERDRREITGVTWFSPAECRKWPSIVPARCSRAVAVESRGPWVRVKQGLKRVLSRCSRLGRNPFCVCHKRFFSYTKWIDFFRRTNETARSHSLLHHTLPRCTAALPRNRAKHAYHDALYLHTEIQGRSRALRLRICCNRLRACRHPRREAVQQAVRPLRHDAERTRPHRKFHQAYGRSQSGR